MKTSIVPGTRVGTGGDPGRGGLDAIGIRQGTELSSLGRDCLRSCERFFAPIRGQAFDLLEIGVGTGASLRTWREWFPAARLTGLDARRIHLDPPIADCDILHGNQADPAVLHRVARQHAFRVVIDDGSRRPEDQMLTFLTLFPWLAEDAVYVCAGLADAATEEAAGETSAAAWFATLGRVLTGDDTGDRDILQQPGVATALHHASGIYLARGCAIVTG